MTPEERAEMMRQDEAEVCALAPLFKARGYCVHIGKMVTDRGDVSPLCAGGAPRPLLLSNGETFVWSPNNYEHVNCVSCMAALANNGVETTQC